MDNILIIDDEPKIVKILKNLFEVEGFNVITAEDGISGLKYFRENDIDVIVSDLKMPELSGMELLKKVREESEETQVVMITAYGDVPDAVKAMKLGAYDFIQKPFQMDNLLLIVKNALKVSKLARENKILKNELKRELGSEEIIGKSKAIEEIREFVKKVSKTKSTVLIQGESGTGKELVAKTIHNLSKERDKPFVKINCPAIPRELLESELFGHEKGSYTGAIKRQRGKFELANGGTVFLDEIGDLPPELQSKLLLVLQEQAIERIGSEKKIKIDVRFIAATNKNLSKEVENGNFRADLYHRLNVIPLFIPPLRERKEDIPALVKYLTKQICIKLGRKEVKFPEEEIKKLYNYDWPGNVRELANLIERSIVLSSICKSQLTFNNYISSSFQR
ncbi:hypothetical protein DRQ09_10325, partial [candidate division KSB1 bacterium]